MNGGTFKKGQRVELRVSENFVASAWPCGDGCPYEEIKKGSVTEPFEYRVGTVISETPGITEMSVEYPIDTYFVPKGTGARSELRDFNNLSIEAAIWRGDGMVTNILYDGIPLEFSTP